MLQEWVTAAVPWMTAGGFLIGLFRCMVIRPYQKIHRIEEQCREERIRLLLEKGQEQTDCLQKELRRLQKTAEAIRCEVSALHRRLVSAEIRLDCGWGGAEMSAGRKNGRKRPDP